MTSYLLKLREIGPKSLYDLQDSMFASLPNEQWNSGRGVISQPIKFSSETSAT